MEKEKFYIIIHGRYSASLEEFTDLAEAKAAAVERIGLTREPVEICAWDLHVLACSEWFGVPPTEEQEANGEVLVRFGTDGYYQLWSDEMETLY